jgi:tRNA pseudouridine55 synthase
MPAPFGFLNIDKPLGLTSHDVVARVRRLAKASGHSALKVGHAGTLDPLATGVLIVCVGGAARLSDYVMHATKRYRARVRLGVVTTTYDAEGEVIAERDAGAISRAQVEAALLGFVGEIDQVPPMYSAIKQGGRKLYDLARAGQTVERAARRVRIDALDLVEWSPPEVVLEVTCSAGTYIRSLAHDLGEQLGVGASLSGLVRLASGSFTLEAALSPDALLALPDWTTALTPPHLPLVAMGWPVVALDAAQMAEIAQGRAIQGRAIRAGESPLAGDTPYILGMSPDGVLTALLEPDAGHGVLHPRKVF